MTYRLLSFIEKYFVMFAGKIAECVNSVTFHVANTL